MWSWLSSDAWTSTSRQNSHIEPGTLMFCVRSNFILLLKNVNVMIALCYVFEMSGRCSTIHAVDGGKLSCWPFVARVSVHSLRRQRIKFYDHSCGLMPRNYAGPTSLEKDGNVLLRPWHLPWESQCGLKGMCEFDFWMCIKYMLIQFTVIEFEQKKILNSSVNSQEVIRQLGQLVCMNGFLTDPSEPGTERLVITKPRLELGMVSSFRCDSSEIKSTDGPEMLQAHGLVYCKGWTRSLVFVLVLHMAFENPTFWEAIRVKSLNYCFESWAATEMWADFTQNAMNICLNLRIWAQALSKGLAGQLQMLRQIKDRQSNLTNLLSRETAFDCFNHDVWRFIFIIALVCPGDFEHDSNSTQSRRNAAFAMFR